MSDVLVLRSPYALKKDAIKKIHDNLVEQKESGVVLVPFGWGFEIVPENIKVVMVTPTLEEEEGGDKK